MTMGVDGFGQMEMLILVCMILMKWHVDVEFKEFLITSIDI